MPIDSTHNQYDKFAERWEKCRDVMEGSYAVKSKTTTYLPKLDGQTTEEYDAYLGRTLFYGATSRTIQGLVGSIFRKPMKLNNIPEKVQSALLEDVTNTGIGFEQFARECAAEVLGIGRYCVFVDLPSDGGDPRFIGYRAENVLNWRVERINNKIVPVAVSLYERHEEPDPSDSLKLNSIIVEKIRIPQLVNVKGGLVYVVDVYKKVQGSDKKESWVLDERYTPYIKGSAMDMIPIVFLSPTGTSFDVSKPPLYDLIEANLSHYMTSADLEHGAHYTGLPTAIVAGFPETLHGKLKIGSSTAWVSEDPSAHAEFMEFNGTGLGALEKRLQSKQSMMAILGARMLEDSRATVETAEAIKLRQSGENSALGEVADALSAGLTECLRWYLRWKSLSADNVSVVISKDFASNKLSGHDLVALVQAWQSGAISFDTLTYQLETGEILPPGRTAEQERGLIEQDPPLSYLLGSGGVGEVDLMDDKLQNANK